jgi:transposase-like protein
MRLPPSTPSVETWGVKYDKAVECLIKDRDALLAFYDFPAEHWKHLRTTNVIESSFATVSAGGIRSSGRKVCPASGFAQKGVTEIGHRR